MRLTPARLSFSSTEVEQTISITSRFLTRHRLLVSDGSDFLASLSRMELGAVSINRLSYGAELEVQADSLGNGTFLLEVPLSGTSSTRFCGRQVHEDKSVGCILAPTGPFSTNWSADCSKLLVTIDRERTETLLGMMLGRSLDKPLAFEMEVPLSSHGNGTLRALLDVIANEAELAGHAQDRSVLHQSLDTAFLSALLLSQPHNYTDRLHGQPLITPWYVMRADKFMKENFARPITLSEIATFVGVSERTLQLGFRKFRGESPMTSLRDRRLDEANRLIEAADGKVSISAIAGAAGFGDMSYFAQAYRRRFGCSPRDRLRCLY